MQAGMCSNIPSEIGIGLFAFLFLYNIVKVASIKRTAHIKIKSSDVPPIIPGNDVPKAPIVEMGWVSLYDPCILCTCMNPMVAP